MSFDKRARYVAMRRRNQNRPEHVERMKAAENDAVVGAPENASPWRATCPYCKENLSGAAEELRAHRCAAYEATL